ncbi:MAG TPA: DNA repair protein RecO [Chthonomonadales bacterium]|nr:DNA repair protein RecO [Chthonomonadales bacterium]
MRTYGAEGVVLRRISLGETDRIVTILTVERGKLDAVAKGARKPGGKLSGASEPFTHLRGLLSVGRTLDVLTQCETVETFAHARGDLDLLARATYLCELACEFTASHEPAGEELALLLDALRALDRAPDYPDGAVHAFELRFLSVRGYAPRLDTCVACEGGLPRGRVAFSPMQGGLLCRTCRFARDAILIEPETVAAMRALLSEGATGLGDAMPEPKVAAELVRSLRWFVRHRAERELRSAEFLDGLRHVRPPGA